MRMHSTIVALFFLAVAGNGTAWARAKPPYEIVRSVQALHDQMALGSRAAEAVMPRVLRELARKLMAAPRSAWHDPRNTRAVIVYILSGGEIRVAQKVLESCKCKASTRRLIEGSLAYLEGYKSRAEALLGNVDPRKLWPAVGSHIALAQAALIAHAHPKKAIALLDLARVLAPGTLVEDAALRREAFLAEETGNTDKFVDMAGQYLRRYKHSVYAERFRRSLAKAIPHMALVAKTGKLDELAGLLKQLHPHERLHLYLDIAWTSLIHGKIDAARWASAKATKLAKDKSLAARRAALYAGAAAILTKDYQQGLGQLQSVESKHLPRDDKLLKAAALGLAAKIRQLQASAPSSPPASKPNATPTKAQSGDSAAIVAALRVTMASDQTVIDHAQKMLVATDALVKGPAP